MTTYIGDPNSVAIMRAVDGMKPKMRALVHEFGAQIVSRMIGDGYDNPDALRGALETWRQRRQAEWLKTDFLKRDG
jgi:hypothetical protein